MSQSRVSKFLTQAASSGTSLKETCIQIINIYLKERFGFGIDRTNTKEIEKITTSTSTTSEPDHTAIAPNQPSDTKSGVNMPYALGSDFAILYFQSLYKSKANLDIQERAFNEFANNVISNTSIDSSIFPKLLCQRFFDSNNLRPPTTIHNGNSDGMSSLLEQDFQTKLI